MVTAQAVQTPSNTMVPLLLSGNMTEIQDRSLQSMLTNAVADAYRKIVEQLDKQSAQTVLESGHKLRAELAEMVVAAVERHTYSDKYKDEQVPSDRIYPSSYHTWPIEAQVTELRKIFPALKSCNEKLARRKLPEGAEAWFAIPRWQAIASSYNEATQMAINALASKRRFSNRLVGKLTEIYLHQTERTVLASNIVCEQQEGYDILVVGAQFGMLHRGSSSRRTRITLAGNEFCLGVFDIACMLLTHPQRLSAGNTLMIDCGGDEYSVRGDYTFDRVPLFDFDDSIEFSIFYEDRARNLWGTPTAFLYKIV
jgi:hypothetical protein